MPRWFVAFAVATERIARHSAPPRSVRAITPRQLALDHTRGTIYCLMKVAKATLARCLTHPD